MKTHFNPAASATTALCGRSVTGPRWITTVPASVDCGACKKYPAFTAWQERAEADAHKAFMAQEPVECVAQFGGKVVCSKCGGVLFRRAGRSGYGHYENYVCANESCGHTESRMTETGMSF